MEARLISRCKARKEIGAKVRLLVGNSYLEYPLESHDDFYIQFSKKDQNFNEDLNFLTK